MEGQLSNKEKILELQNDVVDVISKLIKKYPQIIIIGEVTVDDSKVKIHIK